MPAIAWNKPETMPSRSYVCSYCGESLASQLGYPGVNPQNGALRAWIYICHRCHQPTYFAFDGKQYPGSVFGDIVKDVSDASVASLYEEARRSYSASSYTASVLCCRKLLMHIAVSKGAHAGLPFVDYVQYLTDNHFVPPGAKGWVDHIRKVGNEANHEIVVMTQPDAEELISFCGMLLKIIFEFPAAVARKAGTS